MAGGTLTCPDDSLQSVVGNWWIEDQTSEVRRGRLLWAYVPHVDQDPMTLIPVGREDPHEHRTATVRLQPLRVGAIHQKSTLPVAALPEYEGEVRTVYRAKIRPVLVLSEGGVDVPRELRTGAAKWQTAPTLLVAPYYGVSSGPRAGWRPDFVTRIRRCEYPQTLWDRLPLGKVSESILRLEHLQPIGRSQNAYEWTKYQLSDDALALVDQYLTWLLTGNLPGDSLLAYVRRELAKLP